MKAEYRRQVPRRASRRRCSKLPHAGCSNPRLARMEAANGRQALSGMIRLGFSKLGGDHLFQVRFGDQLALQPLRRPSGPAPQAGIPVHPIPRRKPFSRIVAHQSAGKVLEPAQGPGLEPWAGSPVQYLGDKRSPTEFRATVLPVPADQESSFGLAVCVMYITIASREE